MTTLTQRWASHMRFSGAAETTVVTRVRAQLKSVSHLAPTEAALRGAARWHLPLSAVMCGRLGLSSPFAPGWVRLPMMVNDG